MSCLALLSYVHCTLWVDYVDSPAVEYTVSDRLQELLDTVRLLLSHVETLVQVYQDTLSQMRNLPTNTYAGFDERDVKDYDMSDYDTHLIRDRESKMTDLREDKDCVETTLRTYLMLVFQVFSEPISSLQQSSPTECMPPTSSSSPIHSSPNQKGSLESSNTEAILEFIDVLLTCSKLFEEEYLYSLCVHAIAAVDQQLSVAPLTLLSPVSSPLSPGASTVLQRTPTQCVTTPVAARLAFSAMRTHFDLPTVKIK